MGSKTYRIESFWVALGPGITVDRDPAEVTTQGYIACYGEGERFLIYFMESTDAAPAHAYDQAAGAASIFVPLSAMPAYLDVLGRGETYAYVNSENPGWNCIRTSPGEMAAERM